MYEKGNSRRVIMPLIRRDSPDHAELEYLESEWCNFDKLLQDKINVLRLKHIDNRYLHLTGHPSDFEQLIRVSNEDADRSLTRWLIIICESVTVSAKLCPVEVKNEIFVTFSCMLKSDVRWGHDRGLKFARVSMVVNLINYNSHVLEKIE